MTHTCRRICALLLTLCPQAALAAPNVVLIMSDDAGYADFGFMDRFTGQQTVFKTPNLDRLASESVAFSNAYVPSSICSATRAGILTGRYPEKFAFGYNALPEDYPYEGWTVDQVTLMERLKELGYQTGVVGKWHLGEQPQWRPESQGVDYFYGFWEGGTNYYEGPPQVPIRRGATPIDWSAEPSFNNTPPDPSRGRYLTDALGDEASKYIAERAAGGQPFFLYLPFNGPHSPYDSKAQDDAQFVGSGLAGQRLTVASMTLAVDRAIGHVLSRIDDPNGDGDQSDSIADNTIVVFHNDNGGANVNYNNGPLAGYKGSGFEGGMRTPLLIRAPGLQPGVFDAPVTTLNLFPTLVTAAGGAMTTPADGVDLMPYLRGEVAGEPNPSIAYRNRANFAGIRKGQWKLTRPDALATWKLYRLNPDGSGEDVDLLAQHPEVASELIKEYVAFDVTLDKARNSGPWKVHTNDLFIRRNDAGPVTSWQHSTGWWNGDAPTLLASISREDPSPNFKLAFRPDANADYRSINDVNRASGIARNLLQQGLEDLPGLGEVMLNEIRLEGVFAGSANRKATIEGKPLLLVRDLAGKSPAIRLDAVQAAGPFTYTYNVDLDLYLYHDLVLEGDGNANFRIGGAMSSFDQPSGVTKRGTSNVTLTGHNTFTGELAIEQGEVTLDGAQAGRPPAHLSGRAAGWSSERGFRWAPAARWAAR
ncbi:MAG: hypothetical protein DCC67_00855 [Planctomycetota bacterium]|nr:MAG: hypothetical protein DCC67_00855 [Planctomycetota bacterium]